MMAVAGLQNVPIIDSSILNEPRLSASSGHHGNQERAFSRTSSILQMWRELENESGDALSLHQTRDNENRLVLEGLTDNENVSGTVGDHNSTTSDQSEDLGGAERERVRQIFREWMNTGANGLTSSGSSMNSSPRAQLLGQTELERIRVVREWIQTACEQREEQGTEIGSQIERVREGLVLENSRRDIRRLCGRQALLDLLENNQRERQRELQVLLECCPVSTFASRNRIQSLLRIRLLHNRSVEYNRTNSTAENELGILRQRNTVSGLREGFLSRLDNSGSYNQSFNMFRGNETQPGISDELVGNEHEQAILVNEDSSSGPSNCIEDPYSGNEINEQEDVGLVEASLVHDVDGYRVYTDSGDEELQVHTSLSYPDIDESSGMNDAENGEHNPNEEIHDAIFELHDHGDYCDPHDVSPHSVDFEDQGTEVAHVMDPATYENEQVSENEDQPLVGAVVTNEWNIENQQDLEEEQDGTIEEPFVHEGEILSIGRVATYYHSDDNTAHNIELRELSSRRRVSSLLQSGFRESLNQLIQSYVERQSHAHDSELHEILPPSSVVHDQDIVNGNQNEDSSDVDEHSDVIQSTPFINFHRNREHDFHDIHLSRAVHQSPGTELEMINDLRIEMARLQQRMDSMQTMLETCMDKQIELQRSVRQEVSAALNRSCKSSEAAEDAISRAGSNWDCVRKGICCVCHENKIESLLYRCGHMCTCVNCANALVENKGKCPMCQAPVVEVIRAYTLQ